MAEEIGGKLRMGMVGGGPGSFIGDVHAKAAQFDAQARLIAGAFSRDAKKSRARGRELGLERDRVYGSWEQMLDREAALPEDKRIDFVSVVTPNHLHYEVARAFWKAGFHVVCDKPMTYNLLQAKDLRKLVKARRRQIFALTHNYTGYPMVKLARDLVRARKLGKIVKVVVEYPQGWLIQRVEKQGVKQAVWRTDPARAGKSGCMGDIGTHAANLAEYVTGLRITELCADLTTLRKGRPLDDDGNCLLRFQNGARGILYASQISIGELNGLRLRAYGEEGSLSWCQEEPNGLEMRAADGAVTTYRRGTDAVAELSPAAAAAARIPPGHPEGFYEAFANVYRGALAAMRARKAGRAVPKDALDFPGVDDGVRGMQLIETLLKSSRSRRWVKWVK